MDVVTEEEKEKYIDDYLKHEGIQLDATKVQKNPGLRALSKLCLNSFWVSFYCFSSLKISLKYLIILFSGQVRPAQHSEQSRVLHGTE